MSRPKDDDEINEAVETDDFAIIGEPLRSPLPLRARLESLQRAVKSHGLTGLAADKDFFDELSGQD